jgi:nuclear pore complex protein Nup93
VLQEYQRMVYGHAPADPYKVLLYKIIGRCEIPKGYASTVITTIEDYMWVELALVREEVQDDRNSLEKYRLSDFQKKINDSGRKHFDPSGNNPWFYFKILLLSIQLEKV